MEFKSVLKQAGSDTLLALSVIPRSSKNQLIGIVGGELKIKITAPPVENAANEAVLDLISNELNISKRNLSVERGKTSRHKMIKIKGGIVQQILETLEKNCNLLLKE